MSITLAIVSLLFIPLLAGLWASKGGIAKSVFILLSLSLVALCLLAAWYAWAEPPRSIPWTTIYLFFGTFFGALAFFRCRRP